MLQSPSATGRWVRATVIVLSLTSPAFVASAACANDARSAPPMQHLLPEAAADQAAKTPAAALAETEYVLEQSPLEALNRHNGLKVQQPSYILTAPPGDEVAERRVIGALARSSFAKNPDSLDQLEETLSTFLKTDARTASGASKLGIAYERFDAAYNVDFEHRFNIDMTLEAIATWEQRHPKSVFVPVFKALMYTNIATTGSVVTVPLSSAGSGPVDHKAYLSKARATLEAAPHAADANPQWHSLMISIRAMQSATAQDILALAKGAGAKFPDEHSLFTAAAWPIMFASKDAARDLESLAQAAAENANVGGKNEAFTRVYMAVLFGQGLPAFQFLQMNTDRFAEGAREIAAKHPIDFVYQRLALMSCVLADKGTARNVWKEIRQRPIQSIWGQPEFFDLCQAWSSQDEDPKAQGAEPFEKREFKQPEIEN